MNPNPLLGVLLHTLGGLSAASFYIPYKKVKNWSWETYWLAGGVFSWIVAPWVFVLLIAPDSLQALTAVNPSTLFWTFFFGALWGIGGLTFGLTMRYLGIALGYAIALGLCAAFGTLIPPVRDGIFGQVVHTHSGQVVLWGVTLCLAGIAISGAAGISKERELSEEQKKSSVQEFSFWKGLIVAVFCGILSACMSFAFEAGKPISSWAVAHGTPELWQGLPVLVVILLGGFTTNFAWCVSLSLKNRTSRQYFIGGFNYLLCALAGVTWYLQFFFYSMGLTKMGDYNFSSWILHMASIIIFSTFWGLGLREWRGTSRRTHLLVGSGLLVLIASLIIVGYGNHLAVLEKAAKS